MTFIPNRGRVDSDNSTTSNLGAAATYTGTYTDVTPYSSISVIAKADVAGTLYAEFSTDGVTADRTIQISELQYGS